MILPFWSFLDTCGALIATTCVVKGVVVNYSFTFQLNQFFMLGEKALLIYFVFYCRSPEQVPECFLEATMSILPVYCHFFRAE